MAIAHDSAGRGYAEVMLDDAGDDAMTDRLLAGAPDTFQPALTLPSDWESLLGGCLPARQDALLAGLVRSRAPARLLRLVAELDYDRVYATVGDVVGDLPDGVLDDDEDDVEPPDCGVMPLWPGY